MPGTLDNIMVYQFIWRAAASYLGGGLAHHHSSWLSLLRHEHGALSQLVGAGRCKYGIDLIQWM